MTALTYPVNARAGLVQSPARKATDCEGVSAMSIFPDRQDRRAAFIDGLRRLATYLDEHPHVPVGSTPVTLHYSASACNTDDTQARAEVDRIAALIGATPQTSEHGHYTARKVFGPVVYSVQAVPEADLRRQAALNSYTDNVQPGEAS